MRRICLILGLIVTLSGASESVAQTGTVGPAEPPRIGDFLPDLARNSIGLFSKDNAIPVVVGAGAAAASHALDDRVRDYFARADRLGRFESAGNSGGRAAVVAGTVGILVTVGQIRGSARFRRFTYDLGQATALTGLITSGLKAAVNRKRPAEDSRVSFPSGHTSSTFAIATVATKHYGLKAAIPAYLGASLVAVSRLDAEKHYLSDVVAGATIGIIVAGTSVRGGDSRYPRVAWTPIIAPGTQTVGINLTWNLGS